MPKGKSCNAIRAYVSDMISRCTKLQAHVAHLFQILSNRLTRQADRAEKRRKMFCNLEGLPKVFQKLYTKADHPGNFCIKFQIVWKKRWMVIVSQVDANPDTRTKGQMIALVDPRQHIVHKAQLNIAQMCLSQ